MNSADYFVQRGAHPQLAPWFGYLYDTAHYNGLNPRVTSVYRSRQKQQQLYDRYRAGIHKYPVARPGTSYHEYGRAFDMVAERLPALGQFWMSLGGRWFPSDEIHFQA